MNWKEWALAGFLILIVGSPGGNRMAAQEKSKPNQSKSTQENGKQKVFTNEDLEQLSPGQGKNKRDSISSPESSLQRDTHPKKKLSPADIEHYLDRNGHGRDFWHKQRQSLREKMESVTREVEILEKRKKELTGTKGIHVSRDGKIRASGEISQVEKRLITLQNEKSKLASQIEQLEEEARKAQALPEWLR